MPDLDDDKTDKLFQVGASRHDFEYNPAAWEQMEGMLDADDLRRQRLKWLLAAGGLLLLLMLFFGWFQPLNEGLSENEEPVSVQTKLPQSPQDSEVDRTTAIQLESETGEKSVTTLTPQQEQETPLTGQASNSAGRLAEQNTLVAEKDNEQVADENAGALTPVEITASETMVLGTTGETIPEMPAQANRFDQQQVVSALPLLPITEITYARDLAAPEVVAVTSVPAFEATTPTRGFALSLSTGFASGKTQTGSLARPRLRLGGRLDYRLNNRFSIGTGAFLTKVDYQSDGKEYKTGENFWVYDILPATVDADCDILEIPLSVTWFPKGSDRSGLYFGAGLTSYFMLTEKFDFTYDVDDDELIKNWREDNTNQHLMGMGQLNVGFQRKVGGRSAVQIESFVQLPLTGIGHGKVNLLTVGASVNYSFDFRKRK